MLDRRRGIGQVERLKCETCKLPLMHIEEKEATERAEQRFRHKGYAVFPALEGISFCQCPESIEVARTGNLEFTAADFDRDYDQFWLPKDVVEKVTAHANARLAERLAAAPVVYFSPGPDSWIDEPIHGTTHRARLAVIEELPD